MKENSKCDILVVDDDKPLNIMICKFLEKTGFSNVTAYFSGEELLNEINKYKAPIIIQDYDLPDINGVDILKQVRTLNPKAEFIFLSGQSSIDIAVNSIKFGAFDYIIKDNFAKENVSTKIRNLIRIKQLTKDRVYFKTFLVILMILLLISWLFLLIVIFRR